MIELNRKNLLASITASAREVARGDKAAVAALQAAVALGRTDDDFKLYARAFHVGYIASSCGVTAKGALEWLDDAAIVKRVAKGAEPSPFQRAYGASRTAWSRIREAAGFAKQANKRTRAPSTKDDLVDDEPNTASMVTLIADVREMESVDDVMAALDQVAAYVLKLGNANAGVLTGDDGMTARDCIAAIAKAVKTMRKPAKAAPAPKPARKPEAAKALPKPALAAVA
jgi:hypothetical protein